MSSRDQKWECVYMHQYHCAPIKTSVRVLITFWRTSQIRYLKCDSIREDGARTIHIISCTYCIFTNPLFCDYNLLVCLMQAYKQQSNKALTGILYLNIQCACKHTHCKFPVYNNTDIRIQQLSWWNKRQLLHCILGCHTYCMLLN